MEGTALRRRLTWQLGEVVATRTETARARSLTLAMPEWPGHRPGQHVDVRLTAEDGYQAERSYSIASPSEETPKAELDDLPRREGGLEVIYTLTRGQPPGWTGYHRLTYICGPTQFVETAATGLVALGYDLTRVKTERFGPTGGG